MLSYRETRPTWGLRGGVGRPALDLVALLTTLFVTFSLQFFASTTWLPALGRLTPLVWERGAVWQLVTYPFVGFGPDLWFLLELLVLYFFARDVRGRLGARRFWLWSMGVAIASALAACPVAALASGVSVSIPFQLMQGQRLWITVMVAAFGALTGDATVYLFSVLPVRAGYFPLIGLLMAFLGFLSSHDLPGLVGIVVATGLTWVGLRPGGFGLLRGRLLLRAKRWLTERRLRRLQQRRGWRVLPGDKDGPTIH